MAIPNWTDNWFQYPYNYSNGTAVDGFGSFIQYTSLIVGNWLAIGFILLIWLATFGISLSAGSRKALLVASFVAFPFSIYFVRLEMINPLVVITLIALGILGALGSKEGGSP